MTSESTEPRPLFTRDEFREMEARSPHGVRLERMDGYVYAMAGASLAHERMVTRLVRELGGAADASGCEVFGSNRRLSLGDGTDLLPDVSVYCDTEIDDDEWAGTRPCLIVEVLSRSTALDDLNLKLPRDQPIESVQSILFVNTDPLYAELWRRSEVGGWQQRRFVNVDEVIELTCPPVSIELGSLQPTR